MPHFSEGDRRQPYRFSWLDRGLLLAVGSAGVWVGINTTQSALIVQRLEAVEKVVPMVQQLQTEQGRQDERFIYIARELEKLSGKLDVWSRRSLP